MPDLGWDKAETLAVEEKIQENSTTFALQTVVTITIIITAITRLITTQLGKLARILRKAVPMTIGINRNTCTQNIKDFYKTATLAISIATSTTNRTNCSKMSPNNDRNNHINVDSRKSNDKHSYSYQSHSPRRSGNNNN